LAGLSVFLNGLNVGQNTTLSDGDTGEKFVQLFVVADGQLKVTRDDTGFLVVTGGVTGQLEDLAAEFSMGASTGTGSGLVGPSGITRGSVLVKSRTKALPFCWRGSK
jgi:hypothetical protein